jgi:hypothetical protein
MIIKKESPLYMLNFFTTWLIILVVFNPQVYKYVNLIYLSFIVMMGGLYLSFINPRRFVCYVGATRLEFTGPQKFVIIDMFFHILVYLYIANKYKGIYGHFDLRTLSAVLLIMAYLLFIKFDVKAVYGVQFWELAVVMFVAHLSYILVYC